MITCLSCSPPFWWSKLLIFLVRLYGELYSLQCTLGWIQCSTQCVQCTMRSIELHSRLCTVSDTTAKCTSSLLQAGDDKPIGCSSLINFRSLLELACSSKISAKIRAYHRFSASSAPVCSFQFRIFQSEIRIPNLPILIFSLYISVCFGAKMLGEKLSMCSKVSQAC